MKRRIDAAHERSLPPTDIPTINELWRYQLVDAAHSAAKYPVHRAIHAHHDLLLNLEDARAASDDVLLESLGLPGVKDNGWLMFMVRDLMWIELLANNWNLPFLIADESRTVASVDERRAMAARCFRSLMLERYGVDPFLKIREHARGYMAEHGITEGEYVEMLSARNEWWYFVYTCEAVEFAAGHYTSGNAQRHVLYDGKFRAEFLEKIRAAGKCWQSPQA
jgi:hypothetical protein